MKNGQRVEVAFASPDPSVFEDTEHRNRDDAATPLRVKHPIFDHVEYPPEGGIYAYFKGMPFPSKGFPTPQATTANDMVKKSVRMLVKTLGSRLLIVPALAFSLLPWKMKLKTIHTAIEEWERFVGFIYRPYYLKPERMTPCTREFLRVITIFLKKIGIHPWLSEQTAKAIATMFEYDDAYRYRLEDLMSIPGLDNMSPYQFLKKMETVYLEREKTDAVKATFKPAFRIAKIMVRHPKIKKAFAETLKNHYDYVKFEARKKKIYQPTHLIDPMAMDDADHYHSLPWDQYDFDGLSREDRLKIYAQIHEKIGYPDMVELEEKINH